jgi:hypothetical protein
MSPSSAPGSTWSTPWRTPGSARAMARPTGLRSQTPINHTPSAPRRATASHSAGGTSARVTGFLVRSAIPFSQAQVDSS